MWRGVEARGGGGVSGADIEGTGGGTFGWSKRVIINPCLRGLMRILQIAQKVVLGFE